MKIPVTVVMPETAPIMKISRCEMYGANVLLHGSDLGEVSSLLLCVQYVYNYYYKSICYIFVSGCVACLYLAFNFRPRGLQWARPGKKTFSI